MRYLILCGLLAVIPSNALAASFCLEPSAPYCISSPFTFDDQFSFDQCKRSVERYLEEVAEYQQCTVRAANAEVERARIAANETIEEFNCRAQGNTFC